MDHNKILYIIDELKEQLSQKDAELSKQADEIARLQALLQEQDQ